MQKKDAEINSKEAFTLSPHDGSFRLCPGRALGTYFKWYSAYIHGDLFLNLSQVLNHVSSPCIELSEICMIETSMRTSSITVMDVRKAAPTPLKLSKSLVLLALFHLQWSRKGVFQNYLISRMVFAARCFISGSATGSCFTRVEEEGIYGPLLLGVVTLQDMV